MRISVFGLGYVGCVSAACLAREGHDVIGVDVSETKVQMVNEGKTPIIEGGMEELMAEAAGPKASARGSLRATTDANAAIRDTEVSLICVGTPSERNGSLDLSHVSACASEIGAALRDKDDYHLVVARSTMLPGSVEGVIAPAVEAASGRRVGEGFGVAINPEFLRESTSIEDFYNPPVTVIGANEDRAAELLESMYDFLTAPVVRTTVRTAEMVKYSCNCFHALKVTFANEIGAICKSLDIDSHAVMDIFCMDDKLNLSSYYLKPGFAFGGSCLPKDLRALGHKAKELDVDVPVLDATLQSNRVHVERAVEFVVEQGRRKVGILGLSFKAGTDDLRESPLVTLTESLLGKGHDIRIYDENVALARLVGANRDYINEQIPHVSSLMVESIDAVIEHADVVIVGNHDPSFAEALGKVDSDTVVYDLVRLRAERDSLPEGYTGICW